MKKKLVNIINKCIDRNHSNRYDSIDEIIADTLNLFNNDKEVTNKKLLNASIKVNSAILDNNGMNELSYEILSNAIQNDGNIFFIRTLSGLSVQSGKQTYNPKTPREEAELEDAIKMLEDYSYIKATDYKKDFFKVTKKGYDYFERYIYV